MHQLAGGPGSIGTPLGANLGLGAAASATATAPTGSMLGSAGGNGASVDGFNQLLDRSLAASTISMSQSNTSTLDRVLNFAAQQVGDPYVFGANGPDAWDCSSLVQAAYRQAGVTLPRTAEEQAHSGVAVPVDRQAIKPGDLVFMRGGVPAHDHGHVGIAISATQFIVAPHTGAKVQVDDIPWNRVQAIRRVA
ncbi:MAG: glycoside hydrolase [Acidimicrobiia bacterium]|nr:glycoside hydrolase [Acidimicrobiia bacterium]